MARCLNNLGFAFHELNQLDSADHYAKQGLQMSLLVNDPYMSAFAKRNMGDLLFSRGQQDRAIASYHEVLAASEQMDNTFLKISALHRLGKAYKEKKQYDKALEYLLKDIPIAKQYGYKDEMERTYKMISDVYHIKKD